MENENLIIEIEGNEADDLYPLLISLEVEHDVELASMFRMEISLLLEQEGSWGILDDERLKIWKQVSIKSGFEGADEELLSGYITHVKPFFDSDPSECVLEVWGMDGSVLMDREDKLKDWPNKKDSDIASEILSSYGFLPEVEDSEVIHDEAVSTIIQRETDMQFLKRLALRNGYECYVEGTTGYFKKPSVDEPVQPVLSMQFGNETNMNQLSLSVNALSPANVSMFQIDRTSKELLESEATATEQTTLGRDNAESMLGGGMDPAQVVISRTATTGNPEMQTLCQELYHQGEWLVSCEGEVEANQYGHALKSRQTVPIRGIGETYSGHYYITHVTHTFTNDGYKQFFKGKRNALQPAGDEDFSSSDGLLGGLL